MLFQLKYEKMKETLLSIKDYCNYTLRVTDTLMAYEEVCKEESINPKNISVMDYFIIKFNLMYYSYNYRLNLPRKITNIMEETYDKIWADFDDKFSEEQEKCRDYVLDMLRSDSDEYFIEDVGHYMLSYYNKDLRIFREKQDGKLFYIRYLVLRRILENDDKRIFDCFEKISSFSEENLDKMLLDDIYSLNV